MRMCCGRVDLTDSRPCTERNAQRHPVRFTDTVQRWVGDLRESLREVPGDAGLPIGERIDRVAETHCGDAFDTVVDHRVDEVPQAFLVEVIRAEALMVRQRRIVAGKGRRNAVLGTA
ncbi:Uncharacterised protein [Mycobacteroides abscessus subsp. abscessus]|nr:Uncharacterised protein [Mycobacteroides abscessus subsp. abscessus]